MPVQALKHANVMRVTLAMPQRVQMTITFVFRVPLVLIRHSPVPVCRVLWGFTANQKPQLRAWNALQTCIQAQKQLLQNLPALVTSESTLTAGSASNVGQANTA